MTRRSWTQEDLLQGAGNGDQRALARLLSLVESQDASVPNLLRGLTGRAGTARVIGITGPPGAGKSTTTSALTSQLRQAEHRVGILAVDPSSPFSGGAVLGDRIRMQHHSHDADVYIRSLATRGHLGGLSLCVVQAVRVLEHAGFDTVIIETVGVGQSEVDVSKLADTTIVLLAPGLGDAIQAAKAGILEIGDIFVVNKADREGAEAVRKDLRNMIALSTYGPDDWKPPVAMTVAQHNTGLEKVVNELDRHWSWLAASGTITLRRTGRVVHDLRSLAQGEVRRILASEASERALLEAAASVVDGEVDPLTAMRTYLRSSMEETFGLL